MSIENYLKMTEKPFKGSHNKNTFLADMSSRRGERGAKPLPAKIMSVFVGKKLQIICSECSETQEYILLRVSAKTSQNFSSFLEILKVFSLTTRYLFIAKSPVSGLS